MIFKTHTVVWHLKEGVKLAVSPETEEQGIVLPESSLIQAQSSENCNDVSSVLSAPSLSELPSSATAKSDAEILSADAAVKENKASESDVLSSAAGLSSENDPAKVKDDGLYVLHRTDMAEECHDSMSADMRTSLFVPENTAAETDGFFSETEHDNGAYDAADDTYVQPEFVPVVDGARVNSSDRIMSSEIALSGRNTWMKLPYRLRPKNADIFIDRKSDADFVQSLADFLTGKGLKLRDYDDSVHYLPSDVLIVDSSCLVRQGYVMYLQDGKRSIYTRLLELFPDRLK